MKKCEKSFEERRQYETIQEQLRHLSQAFMKRSMELLEDLENQCKTIETRKTTLQVSLASFKKPQLLIIERAGIDRT